MYNNNRVHPVSGVPLTDDGKNVLATAYEYQMVMADIFEHNLKAVRKQSHTKLPKYRRGHAGHVRVQ